MNDAAAKVQVGSDGLVILPFGNGAERMLGNKDMGCQINNLDFNRHNSSHMARASQEGIVFALHYGMEIMKQIGIKPAVIRAGHANMFLSPVFRETIAGITGATIELYNTDGAQGAAKGAGVGARFYTSFKEAFAGLKKIETVEPNKTKANQYRDAFENWNRTLQMALNQ
jgi:xylulokinase